MNDNNIEKTHMKSLQLQGNKMQILLHIAAWIILLAPPLFIMSRSNVPGEYIWFFYINAFINAIIFYGNYLLLIPRFFFRNIKIRYYIAALVLTVGLFFVSDFSGKIIFGSANKNWAPDKPHRETTENRDAQPPTNNSRHIFRPPFGQMHRYNYAFNALVITIFALGLRVLERHATTEKRQKELEKEKLNSELAFLKNQISPHFFFNTLNNIYSLININTEDSQTAILKLSRMMRYLLYESEQGETKLSNEIDFMNNYIDLMRLRMTEKIKLNVSFPVKYEDISLPPLLFISIVENAFKHGISNREKSFINIGMQVSKEMITFKCMNSIVNANSETSTQNSGIGLENLKKRLNLLFPGKHEFIINVSETTFDVLVKIIFAKT
jgi:two-component system LytT family sensor kinase